jgi:SSS family solute:Na+ symporter
MFGGFRSVVRTDILQFVLMFLGFGLVLPFAWAKLGSFSSIISQLPEGHTTLIGKLSLQEVIAWAFIAMWTIVSPSFYQRCSAAKTESIAKKGILISIGFWFLFDMLTLSAGFYARVAFSNIDPIMSFPLLGQMVLPSFFKGIFFVGMLATIMSSLDSMAFLSAITLGRDFFWRLKKKTNSEKNLSFYTRFGLILTAAFAILIAVKFKSVIDIWYVLGSLAIPILFLPLVTSFFPKYKLPPKDTFYQMVATSIVSIIWLIIGYLNAKDGNPNYLLKIAIIWLIIGYLNAKDGNPNYLLKIEPMYPGFLISILWWILAKRKSNK